MNRDFGIGIDIVSISKVEKIMMLHENFLKTVFTDREIDYCRRKKKSYEHFSVRFAAKEAILKALGTGFGKDMGWTDIEILSSNSGKPRVYLYGEAKKIALRKNTAKVIISLSHCETHAVAQAMTIFEQKKGDNHEVSIS